MKDQEIYYFWKAPLDGLPELTSGGCGVRIIPGIGPFVQLYPGSKEVPKDAIPASVVLAFLQREAEELRKRAVKDKIDEKLSRSIT
jgi:hypothetical protein